MHTIDCVEGPRATRNHRYAERTALRCLTNGIGAVAGSGIGGLPFSLASAAMIENIGLEWSLRVIGILRGIANTLAATFIRDRNAIIRPHQLAFDSKLLRRFDVLLLLS